MTTGRSRPALRLAVASGVNLAAAIDAFLSQPDLASTTRAKYRQTLTVLEDELGDAPITGAALAGVVAQRWHLASPATWNRHVATVRSFARYCERTRTSGSTVTSSCSAAPRSTTTPAASPWRASSTGSAGRCWRSQFSPPTDRTRSRWRRSATASDARGRSSCAWVELSRRADWRPDGRFLFRAEQIVDVSEIYGRWLALWEQAAPEIATFVDAITEGSSYSRARLLASVVALEGYWCTRRPPTPGNRPKLLDKLIALRAHSGVADKQIGATDDNLQLLVAARNLYAHLDQHHVALTDEEIDDELLPNCRRATALMQACLLRDLGITPTQITAMFDEHHAAWPLS